MLVTTTSSDSTVTVGKAQIYELNGLNKVTLSVVSNFEAATTNVIVAVLDNDGAVVKTRVAPNVVTDASGALVFSCDVFNSVAFFADKKNPRWS